MSETMVGASGVYFSYGDHQALRDVDLRVEQGELLGLLGTNGAGKTTLLECLEGLRRPSSGQVRVFDRDPARDRAATRAQMGIMLQEGGFAGELTVRETAELWRGLTSNSLPVEDALARLFLSDRAEVRVKQLSGGERRRLDVVLATMTQPRLLFLDEPTTGLDTQSRQATWDVIEGLRQAGTTIVLTTHYLDEAERLADRLIILHQGRIEAEGTLEEISSGLEATVTFRIADASALPDDVLGRCEVRPAPQRPGDQRVRLQTPSLQEDLLRLLGWAAAAGLTLEELRAGQPTLEDVFMAIVREDTGEAAA